MSVSWLQTLLYCLAAFCFTLPLLGPALINRLRKPGREARAIGHLLGCDPAGWTDYGHVLCHEDSGVCIWTVNQGYGMKWWVGEPADYTRGSHEDLNKHDRQHAYRAVLAWKRGADGNGAGLAAEAALRRLAYRLPHAAISGGDE